jgi:hypothetical protein
MITDACFCLDSATQDVIWDCCRKLQGTSVEVITEVICKGGKADDALAEVQAKGEFVVYSQHSLNYLQRKINDAQGPPSANMFIELLGVENAKYPAKQQVKMQKDKVSLGLSIGETAFPKTLTPECFFTTDVCFWGGLRGFAHTVEVPEESEDAVTNCATMEWDYPER